VRLASPHGVIARCHYSFLKLHRKALPLIDRSGFAPGDWDSLAAAFSDITDELEGEKYILHLFVWLISHSGKHF
jgi:hypothetical protein